MNLSKKHLVLILGFLALFANDVYSQLDTKHYVPPLHGREDYGTHYIVLSTPEPIPFDVTITDGDGTLITTETISNAASSTYNLGTGTGTQFLVTEAELNTIMTGKGLILEGAKPFFVNIRVIAGPQAGSLTSKGVKAALGQEFRTGHLYNNTGDAFRKSATFSIMATEDNTTVNIDDIRPGVIFRGTTPIGAPLTSPSVTVMLDEGECYVVAAYMDEASATENVNGVNGTRITSDKDIVVNTGQWLGGNALTPLPAAGRDLGIDQIVPVDKVGNEYVAIKGEGIDNEKVIVVATVDNTDIMIDGVPAPVATINAGDYYVIDGTSFSANDNLYIQTSEDVYVYQSANGGDGATDDNERQVGLNFLPPVGCSGSKKVILPQVDFIGTAYINIIANVGATVYVDGVPLGAGDAITGTGDYVTYKLTSGYTGDVEITSDDLIRVALINLSGNIGAAGYFSGFTKDVSVLTETVLADGIALEGCIPASFTFSIDGASLTDTEITFTVAGTATNGIDYEYIDTVLVIPAGSTDATIFINSISDAVPEPTETVYIIYKPDECSPVDTAVLMINDSDPIEFTLDGIDLSCFEDMSGEIIVTASGGYPPYTYEVTTDAGAGTTTTYYSSPITPMPAGEYSVKVYDSYGCSADALVIGGSFDADTTFLPDGTGDTYTTSIDIAGFGPTATLDDMSQLQQICMNMEHSYLGDLEIKIIAPSGEEVILKQYPGGGSCDLGEPFASGPVDGADSYLTDPGNGFEYCFNDAPIFGTMVSESSSYTHTIPASTTGTYTDNYLPAGAYTSFEDLSGLLGATLDGTWTLEVTDNLALDNGYIFNWNISLISDLPDTLVTINEPAEIVINDFITEATCGGSDGAINIDVIGDFPPFTYLWSTSATTEDISGLSAGSYTVWVTDAAGCTDSATYILNNTSSLNITTAITNASCAGATDGAIDVSTSGGTPPYTFLWSSSETTEDISGKAAGTYTITITDAAGCIYSEDITIPTLPPITITLASLSNEECGTGNGAIDIEVTGGSGSYGYAWDSGPTTQDITDLSSGNYEVLVTDGNGCTATTIYTILNDVSSCSDYCYLDATAVVTDEECGNGLGALNVTVTDAALPYTVLWSTGATTDDISGLSEGDYTITINDANGCEHIETFTVGNETYTLDLSDFTITDENCGTGDGSIDITVVGGTLIYDYLWSTGATTQDVSDLSEGTYSVTVTDGNGCSFVTEFVVENNTGALDYSAIVTNELCSSGNGGVNLTVTGATLPISYVWSSGPTSEDISGISAGTYSCVITDGSGCILTTEDFIVLNGAGSLDLLPIISDNEDCGNGLGYIDITVVGGSAPYTYDWSTADITEDISGLSAGTYSCTITDDIGCSISTGDVVIFNDAGDLVVETDVIVDEVCGNGEGAIYVTTTGGTAPLSYSWTGGSTSEDLTDVSAGEYTLTVTDASGCSTGLMEVVVNTSGTLALDIAAVTDENCGDGAGAIDITVSGGSAPVTYLWSTSATSEDITSLSEGTYTVTVTDANGCEVEEEIIVDNESGDLSVATVATAEFCSGADGSVDLTVSGGTGPYTYLWNTAATSEDLTGLSAGTYSCEITDGTGCTIATGDIAIANNPGTLDVDATGTDESCGDGAGAADLTVSGGTAPYSYLWSTTETSEDISGLSAGSYTYTVTDAAGCEINGSIEIFNNAGSLSLDAVVVTDELCNDDGGAIDITVSGGVAPVTFLWNTTATSEDLTGLNEGTYSVTISDASGCELSSGDIIVANNAGTLSLTDVTVTNENCGNGIGAIDISLSGGTAPLTYLWSTTATTEDVTLLSEGIYTCTVTDAGGCTVDLVATVENDPGTLSVFDAIVTDEACGDGTGSIDLTIAGGTAPYGFTWSNSATSEDISGLSEGTYSVLITDAGGCSTTADFALDNSGGDIDIVSATIGEEICGDGEGFINITFTGGEAPFTFDWDNGDETEDISSLAAGDYEVTITDINGCTFTQSFTVGLDNGDLAIVSTVVFDETCGDGTGAINVTYVGGAAPITFEWDNAETTEDLTGLSAGDYNLIITDENGCTATTGGTVVNNTGGFSAVITTVTDEDCGDGAGAIDITVSGGTAPYTYLWSTTETTEDISGLSAGDYSVSVTDATGCSIDLYATVENNTGTLAIVGEVLENEDCGDGTGFIDITVSGGAGGYTYLWSTAETTQDISGLSAGAYTCVITDGAGCILNYSADIENTGGSLSTTVTIDNENCGAGNGSIIVDVEGGISPYTFSWAGESPVSCCDWTLEMFDEGWSWNSASLQVFANGVEVGDYTVTGGGENTEVFSICDGDTVELFWNPGGFDDEVSFYLYDAEGSLVYAHGPGTGPTSGLLYTTYASCPGVGPTTTSIADLSAGTYELTITDDVGCSITEYYTVGDDASDISIVTTSVTDATCGNNNGEIAYEIVGGEGPFTTTANGFVDGPPVGLLQNLGTGDWEIVTIDANGCTDTINIFIDNIATFTTTSVIANDWCGQGLGSIDLTVTGESGSLNYSWDFGPTSEDVTGLTAGSYTVTIVDNVPGPGDCEDEITLIVNDSTDIIVTAIATDAFCGDSSGTIDVTVVGETDLTYSWAHGPTTEDLTDIPAGTYTVTVTSNITGCQEVLDVVIESMPDFTVDAVTTDEYCTDTLGTIDLTITGSADMNYSWSNGETTEDIDSLSAGVYSVLLTNNESGCTDSLSFEVFNSTSGMDASGVVTNEVCENGEGAIDLTVTGSFGSPTFLWSTGATTEDISGLSAGTYSVIITDSFDGCQMVLEFTVTNDNSFEVVLAGVIDAVCDTCATGSIDISINEFVSDPPYTFLWDNGATTEDISDLLPGTYTVVVTSGSGCTDTLVVVVGNSHSLGLIEENGWYVNLYPNPTSHFVVMTYDFGSSDKVLMTIHAVTGELVYQRTLNSNSGQLELGLDHLESGVYTIKLHGSERSEMLKLVIAR